MTKAHSQNWVGRVHFASTWAAFAGASYGNTRHAHAALQLVIARQGDVEIEGDDGSTFSGRGLVVASGALHILRPNPDILLILIEPQTALARSLRRDVGDDPISILSPEMCARFEHPSDLAGLFASFDVPDDSKADLDPRLAKALTFLVDTPHSNPIEQAAKVAGLSPSRLRALAKQQLGVPLMDWVMWRKLEQSGRAIMAGESLALAAQAGGFADQAYLTRATRRAFGITPKDIARLLA